MAIPSGQDDGHPVPISNAGAEQARLTEAGLASAEERDTTCCYARQDKFWVDGAPDGERWEIYTVLADSPTFSGDDASGTRCCGGESPAPAETAATSAAPACC